MDLVLTYTDDRQRRVRAALSPSLAWTTDVPDVIPDLKRLSTEARARWSPAYGDPHAFVFVEVAKALGVPAIFPADFEPQVAPPGAVN